MSVSIRPIKLSLLLLLFLNEASLSNAQEYKPRKVLPTALRAITDPKITTVDKARVADNDLVIGVEIDGQARAYPINQLTGPSREIINDELAGTAIAATW